MNEEDILEEVAVLSDIKDKLLAENADLQVTFENYSEKLTVYMKSH